MIDFLLRPWRRHFGPDKAYYRIIEDMFGFVPHNIELYKLALIHKSASLVLEDGRQITVSRQQIGPLREALARWREEEELCISR